MIVDEKRALSWLVSGTFFGYPLCCIKSFINTMGQETKREHPKHPAIGTGFMPCLKCAAESESDFPAWVQRVIEPQRMAPTAFPRTVNLTADDELAVVERLKSRYTFNPLKE